MTYLEATISEVLRHASVVPFALPHSTSSDVSFAGYVIPKGAYIIVRLDTALHDPEVWQEPDKFLPERFIGSDGKMVRHDGFIPFSTGRSTQIVVYEFMLPFCHPYKLIPTDFRCNTLQWGNANPEIKVTPAENPELSGVLSLKAGVGQNIALHASPIVRNVALPVH